MNRKTDPFAVLARFGIVEPDDIDDVIRATRTISTRRWRAQQPKKPKRPLMPCGTQAAYVRHYRHGEVPCDECKEAHREYNNVMRKLKKRNQWRSRTT